MDAISVPGGPTIPSSDLRAETFRSGGPGGQHANTSDTAVRLRFDLAGCTVLAQGVKRRIRADMPSNITDDGELLLVCSSNRSQKQNFDDVRQRLAQIISRNLLPPKRRRATRPTRGSQRRRVEGKKQRGNTKKLRKKVSSRDD